MGKKLTTEGFNAGVKEAHGDCCLSVQSKSVGFIVSPHIIIGLFFSIVVVWDCLTSAPMVRLAGLHILGA